MASSREVAAQRAAHKDIAALARRELRLFWATLDTSDAESVRRELEVFLPELVAAYGDMAAAVAADFFDDLRDQAGAPRRFRAVLPASPPVEQVAASGRWALGPLFSSSPDAPQALSDLDLVVDRLVKQQGRETIALSVDADPDGARYARVPTGAKTCAFCLMLASRGPRYHSLESAGQARSYHGECDCTPTPIWDEADLPAGYDPDALYEQYYAARQAAGSGNTKKILAALREQQGIG